MKPALALPVLVILFSCSRHTSSIDSPVTPADPIPGTFSFDRAFLQQHKDVIELGKKNGPARVLIIRDYQARVMTSTASGDSGKSYGWINYDLIKEGKIKSHINPFGGEDRFWLGPEGGQFALYFKKGDPFDFDHWQTPPLIDTEPFDLVSADSLQATFSKSSDVVNYAGFTFQLTIKRQIKLLDDVDIWDVFDIDVGTLKAVAFQSSNTIINSGNEAWSKKTGLPSIWILGMFNPTDETIIILPHGKSGRPEHVTDDYFGKIPGDRLVKTDSLLLLKGDGKFRSKVGIAPAIAKNVAGSYDPEKHILTLVKFDLDPQADYVNSKWGLQKEPYRGDVLNSYNDGPLGDGSQMGPFYELESSSPARELKKGEYVLHRHTTLHLEGDEETLDQVATRTLGVSLRSLSSAFK